MPKSGITLEYLGPRRPPWKDTAPLKLVDYFDDEVGIQKTARLQFVAEKGTVCICENVPPDAAHKITNSSPVFVEYKGDKYKESRIVGLKAKNVDNTEEMQNKIQELQAEIAANERNQNLAANEEAFKRETKAAEVAGNAEPATLDTKETEKKQLGAKEDVDKDKKEIL